MLTHLVQRSPRRRRLRCHHIDCKNSNSQVRVERVEAIAFSIVYIDIWTAKSITLIALFEETGVKKGESEWASEREKVANIVCWMH